MRSQSRHGLGRPLTLTVAVMALTLTPLAEAAAQKIRGDGPRITSPGSNSIRSSGGGMRQPGGGGGMRQPGGGMRGGYDGGGGPRWGGIAAGVATGIILGIATSSAANNPPPGPPPQQRSSGPRGPSAPRNAINIPPANEQRFVRDEVVIEFAGNYSPQALAALAARHRLAALETLNIQLTNSTYFRGRITDGRAVRNVLRELGNEASLRSGQPNYLYRFAQQASAESSAATFVPPPSATPAVTPVVATAGVIPAKAGDPAQYMMSKLRLSEAHSLARGNNVLVAVIDSGVDAGHPEFGGLIAGTFDALGTGEGPHTHGTAIAGAIVSHSRLMGVAPAARILAIRAFATSGATAEATTFAILKGIDHAAAQGARVINMSFAGPADPGLSRQLLSARGKGIVLIAAAGNLGPKSPPQYPAADPNVIAVTATDADDKLFQASNRGNHIAVAAPGVDILLPAPNSNYQVISGTSFAAAHVSGIAALILERKPGLSPDHVRRILLSTARDLGPRGKDDQFGAGLADAYQAILALEPKTAGGSVPAPRPVSAR